MRKLLGGLLLIAIAVAVVGWYRDWFRFSRGEPDGGKVDVSVTIDKDKIREDVNKAGVKPTLPAPEARAGTEEGGSRSGQGK